MDINDNEPVFSKSEYSITLLDKDNVPGTFLPFLDLKVN